MPTPSPSSLATIDRRTAVEVMGWAVVRTGFGQVYHIVTPEDPPTERVRELGDWNPTRNLDHAHEVAGALAEWTGSVVRLQDGRYQARFMRDIDGRTFGAYADELTEPLAICVAALAALKGYARLAQDPAAAR